MALSAAVNAPFSFGTITGARSTNSIDKGRASDYILSAMPVTRVTSSASASVVQIKDAIYNRYTTAQTITDYQVQPAYSDTGASFSVTIASDSPGVLGSPVAGIATAVAAGTARLIATAAGRPTVVKDITVTATNIPQTDILSSLVSGSATKAMADEMYLRVTSSGTNDMYSTIDKSAYPYTFTRSSTVWTGDWDTSCISPYSNYGEQGMTGTLVSPQHVVFVGHYKPAIGTIIRFIAMNNAVVDRTITGIVDIAGTDIAIGVLATPVPSSINFARVLGPTTLATYMPSVDTGNYAPIGLTTKYGKPAGAVYVSVSSTTLRFTCWHPTVEAPSRSFSIITGDSGNPTFFVIGGQLVLIGPYSGAGSGFHIGGYSTLINAAMSTLGGGYALTPIDLTSFTAY